jgi:hypothetical protein
MLFVVGLALGGIVLGELPDTSMRFAFATFKESSGPITILVGSYTAAFEPAEEFVPLQIAIGIRGKDASLTITPDSFTLIDPDGNSYPTATYSELAPHDRLMRSAEAIDRAQPLVMGQQFANSTRIQSRFYPVPSERIRIPRVHLDRTTYLRDLLYFKRPSSGLDGVLTLRFEAQGMAEPIDVRFEVPPEPER